MGAGAASAIGPAIQVAGMAFSAYNAYKGGQAQARAYEQQAAYNAAVYQQQAAMIEQKKKITAEQYARERGRVKGAIVARTAGKGLTLSGSPLAVMADTESQLLYDQAISDYNVDVERNVALSHAAYIQQQGAQQAALARSTGRTNAFQTILSSGGALAMRYFGPGRL